MKKEILKLCGNVDKSVESQTIFQYKKSFFKKLGVSILACFMFCMPLFAGCSSLCQGGSAASPAPSGPLGDIAPNPVSPLGLDPENDPIIYTTESGLEIKYGGLDLEGTLASGNLKGYPYFTMGTYSGKAVNWVIIGRAPDVTQNVYIGEKQSLLFSTWKANSNNVLAKYFASNTFETNSPAGSAINASTASKSYVVDNEKITTSLSSITSNAEIQSGCVLAISEYCLGNSVFSSGTNRYSQSTLYTTFTNLYNTGLGLTTAQKSLIKPQKLLTSYYGGVIDSYTTDGGKLYSLFPMSTSSGGKDNFEVPTYYLTSASLRLGYQITATGTLCEYWCKTGKHAGSSTHATYIGTGGSWVSQDTTNVTSSKGVRPLCVVQVS